MKRINFQGQESERTQALREAELLSKVRHGHILNYIESFEDDECLNIVTEYCDGGDLEVYLRNRNGKSLPEVRVCHWMFQIASGLQVGYYFISYILGKEPALMGNCMLWLLYWGKMWYFSSKICTGSSFFQLFILTFLKKNLIRKSKYCYRSCPHPLPPTLPTPISFTYSYTCSVDLFLFIILY